MIIFNRDIDLEICEYEYMKDILKQVDYIIVNSDINFTIFEKIELNYPIKIITYGFNPKASILISSVKEDYILISIQRKIQKNNREILENQERKIETKYNEKTIALKKELSKILPNVQKVSSEADMNVKLVSKLIKESSDAKDFLKKASLKKVYENGKTIFILDWLYKKGIPVPLRTAISDKYSKNLSVVSWNELFKDKEFLNSLNGYGKDWENFKIARGNLRTLEDFKKFREQYGKDFEVEINILCKDFIEQEKRQQNSGTGEKDNQEQQTKTPAELAAEYIRKRME